MGGKLLGSSTLLSEGASHKPPEKLTDDYPPDTPRRLAQGNQATQAERGSNNSWARTRSWATLPNRSESASFVFHLFRFFFCWFFFLLQICFWANVRNTSLPPTHPSMRNTTSTFQHGPQASHLKHSS